VTRALPEAGAIKKAFRAMGAIQIENQARI